MASSLSLALCAGTVLCMLALPACGHREYRARIPNYASIPCPAADSSCEEGDVCEGFGHMSCLGGVETPKRNPFGQDFEAAGEKWTVELCQMDSDGDGFTNGQELGDPCCIWQEGGEPAEYTANWMVSHPGWADSAQPDPYMDFQQYC